MGKLAENRRGHRRSLLAQLQSRRRKLSAQLAKIDKQLSKAAKTKKTAYSPEEVDRWLDELSADLEHLSPLPDEVQLGREPQSSEAASGREWLDDLHGAFAGDPIFEQAMKLGREYRRSLRPRSRNGARRK